MSVRSSRPKDFLRSSLCDPLCDPLSSLPALPGLRYSRKLVTLKFIRVLARRSGARRSGEAVNLLPSAEYWIPGAPGGWRHRK